MNEAEISFVEKIIILSCFKSRANFFTEIKRAIVILVEKYYIKILSVMKNSAIIINNV